MPAQLWRRLLQPDERRGGRAKGVPNKLTASLKAMILGALDKAGGEAWRRILEAIEELQHGRREGETAN